MSGCLFPFGPKPSPPPGPPPVPDIPFDDSYAPLEEVAEQPEIEDAEKKAGQG